MLEALRTSVPAAAPNPPSAQPQDANRAQPPVEPSALREITCLSPLPFKKWWILPFRSITYVPSSGCERKGISMSKMQAEMTQAWLIRVEHGLQGVAGSGFLEG